MPEFNNPTTTLTYLEKGDKLMGGTPSEFANILAENLYNRTLTRAQLQALITASGLNIGQQYTISNSVGGTFALKVTAAAVNVLDETAVRVSNGENYIYDIVTDVATQSSNEIKFQITDPSETSVLSYDDAGVQWINKEVNDILPQSIETDASVQFAQVTSNAFVKSGSSNSFFLLGGGGDTAISNYVASSSISGTAGTIAKFDSGGASVVDSIISESGGAITIAGQVTTTSLNGYRLLSGSDVLFSLGYTGGTILDRLTGTNFFISENGSPQMSMAAGGATTFSSSVTATKATFTALPTSAAGLSAGDLWNDSGTVKIV